MKNRHNLLKRQILRHFGPSFPFPPQWQNFLDDVDEAYIQSDVDREMLERSLDLSSQELLQANSELRAIIQAFPDLLLRIDHSGKILDHRISGETDLFAPGENLIGKHIQDIPHREVSRKFRDAIGRVHETGDVVSIEYALEIKGKQHSYEARLSPMPESQIMVIIRNITDHKLAEDALKESEQKFRAITSTAADAIILMDDEGKVSYWNPAAEKIFGYHSDSAFGKDLHRLLAQGEYHGSFREGFEGFKTTGQGIVIGTTQEFSAIREDGTLVPIEVSTSAMKIRGRWHAVGIVRDITRRRNSQTALKESEEKYRTLVNNISIGVYRKTGGPEGKFIQANPAMVRILGYDSADDFMNVSDADLYEKPEEGRRFLEEAQRSGLVKDKELRLMRKDGTSIWASCSVSVQFDGNGAVRMLDGVIEDITERKKFEEQIRQAQKMEAIGTLAGGIAHDFNNILTAVIGYGNLLKEELRPHARLTKYVEQVLSSADRAADLTQRLLAFSRRQMISPRASDINEIIKRMEGLLFRVIGEDIELQTLMAPGILTVMADPGQMEQVLMNLAANARDAMPDGGILTVSTEVIELDDAFTKLHGYGAAGSYVRISIQDTGHGMDEETRERIFDPFFTTKEVGRGTGLGLAMVYGIIKQHEGYINVYSETGKGTVFKIYLPLIKSLIEEEGASPPDSLVRGGTETILVAEDDVGVRKITRDILERAGYTVIEAVDGQDAIDTFLSRQEGIHLLLIDVIMPKKSGTDVYEEIKKIKPDIKALFFSGYTASTIHRKGIMEESRYFIQKPVLSENLLKKIRAILDQ